MSDQAKRLRALLEDWTQRREYWEAERVKHDALGPDIANASLALWAKIRRECYDDCLVSLRAAVDDLGAPR